MNSNLNNVTNNEVGNANWGIFLWQSNFNSVINNTIFNTTTIETPYANTTEKDDVPHLQPLLEKVVEMYGLPIAVISDMQPAIIEAVKNVMPGIPHQFCQYHFIKNAGNFMKKEYKELGKAMKKKEVLANAQEVVADFKKTPK
uniref:MULE transposase domain-containing protein n=1 Tax=Candidatus Methanophagaceae archaeon ANME-1 ERB6 TaxID=2759912 RepID=A0A7G9YW67_9EURY|nr:hypothetical protein BPDGFPMF_00010 [Methanosarcinales archaeon ANME-1 ERB6]